MAGRLRRFAGRHRPLVAAGLVGFAFAAATPALLLWQSGAANLRLRAAVDVSLDAVDTLLARVAAERVRNAPAMQRVAVAMLQDAMHLFDRLAADGQPPPRLHELRHRALTRLAHLHLGLGETDAAASDLERLRADARQPETAAAWLDRARAEEVAAFLAARRGHADEARRAIAAAEAAFTNATADTATVLDARSDRLDLVELRASMLDEAGKRAEAIAALRAGITDGETLPPSQITTRRIAALRVDLAGLLDKTSARAEALRELDAVVAAFPDATVAEFGWPVPRMQLAQAKYSGAAILAEIGDQAASRARYVEAMVLLDALVVDYPEDPTVRRLRARATNQVANAKNTDKDFQGARALLQSARGDLQQLLAKDPKDVAARGALGGVLRATATAARGLQDWTALEAAARDLLTLPDGGETTGRAARELLRCAEASPDRAAALRLEALSWLERAVAAGFALNGQDPLYAPLREVPRFRALLPDPARH